MRTDAIIKEDVLDELAWESSIDSTEIGVTVIDGIVTLHGHVGTYTEKGEAENAAKRVKGVRAVVLDLKVELTSRDEQTDEKLAKVALDTLEWNTSVPHQKLTLKVDNGWITIEGEVEWQYQKMAAYNALKNLKGVRGVTNRITIVTSIDPQDIKDKIRKSFERNALIDADSINVKAEGHKVVLTGTVESLAEKKHAKRIAWLAPGVNEIEDNIVIKIREEAY